MKCYPDCNSNSCCVHQLDGSLNHSVKSHSPQCCACFLYLLPFHQNHSINSTESCFPVEHRWLYRGGQVFLSPRREKTFSELSARHAPCSCVCLTWHILSKVSSLEGTRVQAKTYVHVDVFPYMQDASRRVLVSAQLYTLQLQSGAFCNLFS